MRRNGNMRARSCAPALLLGLLVFVGACTNPFVVACRDIATDPEGAFKYSEEEAPAACAKAQQFAKPGIFEEQEDGTMALNRRGLAAEDVAAVLKAQAKDLDHFLSFENEQRAHMIDWFRGLRAGLENQERVTHAALERFALVRVWNEFTEKVSPVPESVRGESEAISYFFPAMAKSYSLRLLYSPEDVRLADLPFVAEYLETAKREGTLKRVEQYSFGYTQKYAERIRDLYDPNKFRWKSRARKWTAYGYKIVPEKSEPDDATVHYVEVFRVHPESGEPESLPAVRGFLSSGGSHVTVFLVDYDKEGETGHGVPNAIETSFVKVNTIRELFDMKRLRDRLLARPKDEGIDINRPERQRPPKDSIYIAIARAGTVSVELWESGEWRVPFDYTGLSVAHKINYVPSEGHGTVSDEKYGDADLRQIDRFVRVYSREVKPAVLEYWKPKAAYAERDIVKAFAFADGVRIRRKSTPEFKAGVEYFAERVEQIDYYFGGKWFRIRDEDGDGAYEKRREISEPQMATEIRENAEATAQTGD